MASRVIMPKLTDSMEEGVVVKWRKAEGDRVESGDVLAEIETDKAVMDLEAFGSGTLRKILVPEGSTVPSGTLIGLIAEPDEDIESLSKSSPAAPQKAASETEALGEEPVLPGKGSVTREKEPVPAGSGRVGEMADPGWAGAPGKGSVSADPGWAGAMGTIEVSVSDTGSGIGGEELGKIFNPYFTTKKLGIGLGLAITKKIVEEHGGRISVTSRALEGTTVVIDFPINEVTEVAA